MKYSFLIFIFMLLSCSSQTTTKCASNFFIKRFQSISLIFISDFIPYKDEIKNIERKLLSNLKDTNIFEKISTGDEDSDLIIKIYIEDLIKVSKFDRIWFGAMAGRDKIKGKIILIEGTSGKILSNISIESISSGGSIFAGTTDQVIDNFVTKVTEIILKYTIN